MSSAAVSCTSCHTLVVLLFELPWVSHHHCIILTLFQQGAHSLSMQVLHLAWPLLGPGSSGSRSLAKVQALGLVAGQVLRLGSGISESCSECCWMISWGWGGSSTWSYLELWLSSVDLCAACLIQCMESNRSAWRSIWTVDMCPAVSSVWASRVFGGGISWHCKVWVTM